MSEELNPKTTKPCTRTRRLQQCRQLASDYLEQAVVASFQAKQALKQAQQQAEELQQQSQQLRQAAEQLKAEAAEIEEELNAQEV